MIEWTCGNCGSQLKYNWNTYDEYLEGPIVMICDVCDSETAMWCDGKSYRNITDAWFDIPDQWKPAARATLARAVKPQSKKVADYIAQEGIDPETGVKVGKIDVLTADYMYDDEKHRCRLEIIADDEGVMLTLKHAKFDTPTSKDAWSNGLQEDLCIPDVKLAIAMAKTILKAYKINEL